MKASEKHKEATSRLLGLAPPPKQGKFWRTQMIRHAESRRQRKIRTQRIMMYQSIPRVGESGV